MLKRKVLFFVIGLTFACQVIPTPPALETNPPNWVTPGSTPPGESIGTPDQSIAPTPRGSPIVGNTAPGELEPFPELDQSGFAPTQLTPWEPNNYPNDDLDLPILLDQVVNLDVVAGLTNSQRASLSQHGFVVVDTQEDQFSEIRDRVSMQFGQPYFLTTDAAYHALHLTLNEVLIALEREELRPRLINLIQAVLHEVASYMPFVQGDALEEDIGLAATYLGVGLRLLDPQANLGLEPNLEALVVSQVDQIIEAGGVQHSILLPDLEDDYREYKPTGHYAGDEELSSYFRGLTWLRRAQFRIGEPGPRFEPSHAPLIITLAIRRAETAAGPAAQEWDILDDTFSFLEILLGEGGPRLHANLMDQVYGRGVTFLGLSNDPLWQNFLDLAEVIPPLRDDKPFADLTRNVEERPGWRFFGGSFNLDDYIFQNLVYPNVGNVENQRLIPSGLDLAIILGSTTAMQIQGNNRSDDFSNYTFQVQLLQNIVGAQSEKQWLGSAYSAWLYAALPQPTFESQAYPEFMQTPEWSLKSLNSALGSWVERKNDVLDPIKLPEVTGGGGPPSSGPAPGYVEPQPMVFYRLAYLAGTLAQGLKQRGLMGNRPGDPLGLSSLLDDMEDLADRLEGLGEIAVKELDGLPLDQDDYWLIQAPMGPMEGRSHYSQLMKARGIDEEIKMPQVAMIATIAGSGEHYLQAGIGHVNRIYVIVPLKGDLYITQGGVYSYYEFPQPFDELLTNQSWRRLLLIPPIPKLPEWSKAIFTQDGYPVDVLAFQVGDIYRITQAGGRLVVRDAPARQAVLVQQLRPGDYVMIVDGPVQADGFRWWKLNLAPYAETSIEGWAVENPEWYERAWGQ